MSASTVERHPPRVDVQRPPAAPVARSLRWLPWVVLLAVMAGAAVLLMWAGRDTTFFYDDWPFVQSRGDWNPNTLLRPHNEHLSVFPLVLYKVLFETVGLHEHWVYRAALVALNLGTGLLLFLYARRRITDWPAVALAACLIVMAPSWYNLVYSFQVNFVGAMAAGMGALLALDREDRKGDVLAALLLGVAIGSSSVGFPFLLAVVVELVWRRDWRRLAIAGGIPIFAYVVWMIGWGTGNSVRLHNAPDIPGYMIDGADDAAGAITGYGVQVGLLVFWTLAALTAREVIEGRVSARLVAAISMPLSLWALTALGRADMGVEADANRYLYAAGLFVALVALEVARRHVISGRAAAVLAGFLFVGAIANANAVDQGGDILREWSSGGKYGVTALEIAGPENVPREYDAIDPTQNFIKAGGVWDAIERYGSSPGYTMEELREAPKEAQRGVDEAIARMLNLNVAAVDPETPVGTTRPEQAGPQEGSVYPDDPGCVRLEPGKQGASFHLRVPPWGLVVRAGDTPAEVRLRRFSTLFPEKPLGKVDAGGAGSLAIPRDRSDEPWDAKVNTSSVAVVCAIVDPI